MENKYLSSTLGLPLKQCIAELALKQPPDPIEWIAQWLYRYSDNEIYYYEKSALMKSLYRMQLEMAMTKEKRQRNISQLSRKIRDIKIEIEESLMKYNILVNSMGGRHKIPKFMLMAQKKQPKTFKDILANRPPILNTKGTIKIADFTRQSKHQSVHFPEEPEIGPDYKVLGQINPDIDYIGRISEGLDLLGRFSAGPLGQSRVAHGSVFLDRFSHTAIPKAEAEFTYPGQGPLDDFGIGGSKTDSQENKQIPKLKQQETPPPTNRKGEKLQESPPPTKRKGEKVGKDKDPDHVSKRGRHRGKHRNDEEDEEGLAAARRGRNSRGSFSEKSKDRFHGSTEDNTDRAGYADPQSSDGHRGSMDNKSRRRSLEYEDGYGRGRSETSRRSSTGSSTDATLRSGYDSQAQLEHRANMDFVDRHGLHDIIDSDTNIAEIRNSKPLLKVLKKRKASMGSATWEMDCNLGLVCNHSLLGIMRGRAPFVAPETPEWWEKQAYALRSLYDHEIYSCENNDVIKFYNYVPHLSYHDFVPKSSSSSQIV